MTSSNPRPTPGAIAVLLAAVLPATLLLVLAASTGPASAIPANGAGPDTPGTSSSLSSSQVQAGGSLGFTVRGYPGGETLYIKIDNEGFCTSPPFGACVYHQQAIPANGTVSGTITLPAGLGAGRHTLRFLASETGSSGELIGYTRESPAFTVVAAGSGAGGSGGSGSGGSADSGGSGSGGTGAGDTGSGTSDTTSGAGTTSGSGTTDPGAAAPAGDGALLAAPGATASPGTDGAGASAAPTAPAPVMVAPQVEATADDDLVPMPWIGLYVLLGCLLLSSLMTTIAVLRRR